jgi:hypothetical protein
VDSHAVVDGSCLGPAAAVVVDSPCTLVEGMAVVADGKDTMRRVIGLESARRFDGVVVLLRVLLSIN